MHILEIVPLFCRISISFLQKSRKTTEHLADALSLPVIYFLSQVEGERTIRMGMISRRPRSMAAESVSFPSTE